MINTTAKYLLEDVDFSGEGAHLAMTLNEFGGSAAKARDEEGAYLYKSKELPEEGKQLLQDLNKVEMSYNNKREKLQNLLEDRFIDTSSSCNTISSGVYVRDYFSDSVIFEYKSKSWKLEYTENSEGYLTLSSEDPEEVDVITQYTSVKNSPEEDVDKSEQENKDSDAMSESNNNQADIGINKNNKEETMATETPVDVTKSEELAELQKSMQEMQDLLKAEKEAREAAEAKAEEIAKAAEEERIEKAKAELTEVVKGWDIEKCEGVSQESLVSALFKSEDAALIMKAMEHLNDRIDTLKSEFGKEEGLGGELKAPVSDVQKTHDDVTSILKARAEKAKAAKAGK